MSKPSLARSLYSLPTIATVAAAAFLLTDLLPACGWIPQTPYSISAILEGVLILQLMAAWRDRFAYLPLTHLYILFALFFLRLVFRPLAEGGLIWAMRAGSVHPLGLGAIGYLGIAALHPRIYRGMEQICQRILLWPAAARYVIFLGFVTLFTLACFHFPSYHITRDGFDWIERTTQPVWQIYLREPLTIGLYRWIFLFVWERWEMTSFQVIGLLSIGAGIWWVAWMGLLIEMKWSHGFDRFLAWMLTLSSGGLLVLFFAHIEVYPIQIAGLTPAFYYACRYLEGKSRIGYAGVFYSIALLLHLSSGWLLPAFLLLPWFQNGKDRLGDLARFVGIFVLIQVIFWGSLMVVYYENSPAMLFERLYEQFHVGLERDMFLPQWAWLIPGHFFDLFNVYVYYSLPCFLLFPVCLTRLPVRIARENGFWIAAALGYFLYTFFWHADRGYPEDWDLFSPITLIVVILWLHLLLPLSTEKTQQATYSTDYQRSLIYLASVGTFFFAASQVYYHHTVPFIRL